MATTKLHRLLRRQLKKLGIDDGQAPAQDPWRKLLAAISRSYTQADQDRYLLEHSLEISSQEMRQLNEQICRNAQAQLDAERERAHVALQSIGDAVITADTAGHVEFMNPAAEKILGLSSDKAAGIPIGIVFRTISKSMHDHPDPIVAAMQHGRVFDIEPSTFLVDRELEEIAISGSVAPLRNHVGETIGCVVVFRDISEATALQSRLEHQARHDMLTGLFNRYRFDESLKQLVMAAQRDGSRHALLYLDLDQFKIVNDTCGHLAGDELLKEISSLLKAHTRHSDTLARLGGDEFGLLLQNCPLDTAIRIAQSLSGTIRENRFSWHDSLFEVGVSIGLVEISSLSESANAVLSAADVACYAAKEKGRNQIHIFEAADRQLSDRRGEMDWVSRITRALDQDRFVLYRQAIVPVTDTGSRAGHYEVLLRLQEDDGSLIPPGAFIPAAERFGLMASIDRWVIRNTLGTLSEHPALLQQTGTCAINLSGNSLSEEGLLDYIQTQIDRFSVPADKLCFEITETATIANLANVQELILSLREDGCRFALDDFGSGLSSFAYLKELPVDYLKIDGCFVRDICQDPVDLAMVKSINQIGHTMGIRTIAEFVENDAILFVLQQIGVDHAQGYGIEKPSPLVETHAVTALSAS